MKTLFFVGLAGLAIFEILKVYFIMPMPGSQEMDSIGIAYALYTSRWIVRTIFLVMILAGSFSAVRMKKWWIPLIPTALTLVIVYFFNFRMTADHMFLQPEKLVMKARAENALPDSSIVVAVYRGGEAKAYPIRYIGYHHQIRDSIGGQPIMVTYCTVCRTGRVFEPVVDGKPETFRLVGMDHFNAMFEDEATSSWWRQANGMAVAGPSKGKSIREIESFQLSVNKFFSLYPFGKVMQEDAASTDSYDSLARYERGKSKNDLTRTDSLSWNDKSWVVGVTLNKQSKAYDWNDLKSQRVIHDVVGKTPVLIVISQDERSFAAFQRNSESEVFTIKGDTLSNSTNAYRFDGSGIDGQAIVRIQAYQEFWHSWRTFHPESERYSHALVQN